MFARKRDSGLTRAAALEARPHATPRAQREGQNDGSMKVVVRLRSSKWQKWFGAPPEYERTYLLDALGREVYQACDGERPVREIVEGFAAEHRVSVAEAEKAVTIYLKTLIAKGLVVMEVDI